jgi:hypothetical protein
MTKLILLTALFFNLLNHGLTITDKQVLMVIDRSTTQQELSEMKVQLWKVKGITFDVELLHLNKQGDIVQIKISVDCHDGFKGTASRFFNDDIQRIGFYRSYEDVDSPFEIGSTD